MKTQPIVSMANRERARGRSERLGRGLVLGLLIAGGFLGGCTQEFGVALTIKAGPLLTAELLEGLTRLDLRVTRVDREEDCRRYDLRPSSFDRNREARLFYMPTTGGGDLTFTVAAYGGPSSDAGGYGAQAATIVLGTVNGVELELRRAPAGPLCTNIPDLGTGDDLQGPPDLVTHDLAQTPQDLAVFADLQPPPDAQVADGAQSPPDLAITDDLVTPIDRGVSTDLSGLPDCNDNLPCTDDVVVEVDGRYACMNRLSPQGTVCRRALDSCDVEEVCDGSAVECPPDTLHDPGFVCRPAKTPCDVPETCSGSSPYCPPDPDPALCELLVNGDFSQGRIRWEFKTPSDVLSDTGPCGPLSIPNYNLLCTGINCDSETLQPVTLPPGASGKRFQLSFWLNIIPDPQAPVRDDFFAEIVDGQGVLLRELTERSGNDLIDGYQRYVIDLGNYQGQALSVRFRALTAAYNASFCLDDVSLIVY
jgi:hypothetical protein